MTEKISLQGQVALITGASQGIGMATARALAEKGMHLVLAARSADKLEGLAAELRQQHDGCRVVVCPCDVRDVEDVQKTVAMAMDAFDRIDALVNNAGVAGKIALLQEVPTFEVDRVIDTNLKGPIYCMQAVLPVMIQQQSGVVININSIAGRTAFPFWSVYDASKFGLRAITDAVAEEQAQNGIKVIGIYPGAVHTEIWDTIDLGGEPNLEGMLDADTVAGAVVYALEQPAGTVVKDIVLSPLKPAL